MLGNIDINVTLSWSPFLLILAVLASAGVSFWLYRRTIPPVSRLFRRFLTALRTVVLTLILVVIFEPVLHITHRSHQRATVGLLVDHSGSMQISDDAKSRSEILGELLRSREIVGLKDRYDVAPYLFSDQTIPVKAIIPDSLVFDGIATDIAQVLEVLATTGEEMGLSGVLLLSDGAHNRGEDPVRKAETLGFPVYTVAIGDPRQKPDLLLTRILTNEIVYVGDRIPVDVSIRGPGFDGRRVDVRLRTEDEIIDQKTIPIPSSGLETSIRFYFAPENQGFQKMVAEVSPLDGEVTFENNRQTFYVKVLKSRLRVLLLAAAPSPDLAFVKRILSADENLELISRTEKRGGGFYEGFLPPESETQTVDALVLLDIPSPRTSGQTTNLVTQLLRNERKPFLLIVGKQIDVQKLSAFRDFLPCDPGRRTPEISVFPRLTSEGEAHPVLRIDETMEKNQAVWSQLPPLFSAWTLAGAKPGSQLLVTGVPENLPSFSDQTGSPLMIARHVGEVKSVVFLGHGLYRWDLLTWGAGGTNAALKGFLHNAIRWLVTREEDKPVRVHTDKRVYASGENILFSVQVYDETYHPVERASVAVKVISRSGESTLQLAHVGDGRYRGEFRAVEDGTYRYTGTATLQDRSLGEDEGEFSVTPFNIERFDTRANPDLLEALVRITGGRFGLPDSLSSVVRAMDFPTRVLVQTKEIELYSIPWTLAVIVLLLSAEWFVRKRKGMV